MATARPNMVANMDDKQLTDIKAAETNDLNKIDQDFGKQIADVDNTINQGIKGIEDYKKTQTDLQEKQGALTIQKLENDRANAQKDYLKEQTGAYVDWQKQSNKYGANAEQMAASGLMNSGYSESSQVAMYNAYQNRVAAAREAFVRASTEYDIAIKDAQLQNDSLLAEIAFNTLQQKLELSLQGLQYKNQLLSDMASLKLQTKSMYADQWKTMLDQINREKAAIEAQYQFDKEMDYKNDVLQLEKDQFDYEKEKDAAAAKIVKASSGSGGSSGGSSSTISSNKNSGGTTGKVTSSKKVATSSTSNKKVPEIDMNSVLALGFGPISEKRLSELVDSGVIMEYTMRNGKIGFKLTAKGIKNKQFVSAQNEVYSSGGQLR